MRDKLLYVCAVAMAAVLFVAPGVALADEVEAPNGALGYVEASVENDAVVDAEGVDSSALAADEIVSDEASAITDDASEDETATDASTESNIGDASADATQDTQEVPDSADQGEAAAAEDSPSQEDMATTGDAKPDEEPTAAPDALEVSAQAVTTQTSSAASTATTTQEASPQAPATTTDTTTAPASAKPAVTVKAASTGSESAPKVNPAYEAGFRDGHFYLLASNLSSSRVLTASGSSVLSSAITRSSNQFWKAVFTTDGYLKFINKSSGLALGVSGGKAANGAKVGAFTSSNAKAQKWTVTKFSDGSYSIVSALSGSSKFVLDIAGASKDNGAVVQLYKSNKTDAQKWKKTDVTAKYTTQDNKAAATTMPKGTYVIASALGSSLTLTNSNDNVQSNTYNAAKNQKWTLTIGKDGYATVKAADGRVLDIASGKAVNGTNVQLYASNNSRAQKWIVTKNADGTYKLESALWPNLVLDVAGGAKSSGTNVQVYFSNSTASQKWDLVNAKAAVPASDTVKTGYYIFWTSAAKTLCLDVNGAANANGTAVQLYSGNGSIAQHFRIVKSGNFYRIEACCAPGKRLDYDKGKVVPGTKVQTWNSETNNSLFSFKKNASGSYQIINVASGLALGVSGSAKKGAAIKGSDGVIGKKINFVLDKRSGVLEEGTYSITTELTGNRAVTVKDDSWSNGAKLDMETYIKNLDQKWYVKPVEGASNTYTIESLSSGLRLSGANNAAATQSSDNTTMQRWVAQAGGGNTIILKNVSTGKALDVSGASTAQGAAVMNWTKNGTTAQKWNFNKVRDVDSGIYEFKLAASTGKSLDVDLGSSNVQVWSKSGSPNQRWYYDASARTITSIETGKVLDVSGANKASGTNVQQYESNGTTAQKWTISYDGSGRFKVTSSLGSTLVLTSAAGSDGANVSNSTDKAKTTQRWRMKQTTNNKPSGFNLITSIISNGHGSLNASYVVIHETANPGATAKNHRDYWKSDDTYAVHYVLDWTGNCYYCVPENRKCWQVGNGNKYVVGIELCHATNKSDFNKVWNGGVEWARWQLAKNGWGVDRLISHYECTTRWGGSDHTDPIDYFASYGKSWSQFKNDVAKALARGY